MKRLLAALAATAILVTAAPAVGHDGDRKHNRIHRLIEENQELRSRLDNASVNIVSLFETIEDRNRTIQEMRETCP